jgi:hypothetical protein
VILEAQKQVMRHLVFKEKEVIDPKAQDVYSKLFSPMLSDSHVSTIATIFGWTVGEGEQVRSVDVVAVL